MNDRIYTDADSRADAILDLAKHWERWYDSPASYKASTYDQAFEGCEHLDADPEVIPHLLGIANEMDDLAMTGAGLVEVAELFIDWLIEQEAMRL